MARSRIGVPYEIRTRVTAVKEKRFTVIQGNLAAWIAVHRTLQTDGNAYWTLNGLALGYRRCVEELFTRETAPVSESALIICR